MQRHMQFVWDGLVGDVRITCIANDDPEGYGCWNSDAVGYPVCTATVRYARLGYGAMFGWVQLVRSTDNDSRGEQFEVDPFALFGDAQSPYCWYGTEPTLFDAPSRFGPAPADWLAQSYLATTPINDRWARQRGKRSRDESASRAIGVCGYAAISARGLR